MGGTRKNNNNGNGPGKRKENAKKSLQNRFKNDTEIKRLIKTIQDSKHQRDLLLKEKRQLTEMAEERALRISHVEDEQNLKINKLGLTTFIKEANYLGKNPDKTNQLPITVDGFRRAVSCMAMMVDDSKDSLDLEAGCLRDWLHAFIHILNKQKVAEDKLKLLRLGSDSITTTTGSTNSEWPS